MNVTLLELAGAIGFQINDTWTTFLGVGAGAAELNKIFKFLSNYRIKDFIFVGIIKVLVAIFVYVVTLVIPEDSILLAFDFYLEVAVTMWNILTIYRHRGDRNVRQ